MCNAIAAQIGIAAAGGLAKISGHNKQAEATAAAAKLQQEQVNAQTAERTDARIREARELRASLRAQSADAGIGGNSVVLSGNDMMGQAGRDTALLEKNRKTANKAIVAEAKARIRASRSELLGGLLGSGGSAFNSYMIGKGN